MLKPGCVIQADNCEYRILENIGRGARTAAYIAEHKCGELVSKCILKEYSPHNTDGMTEEEFNIGKERFLFSGNVQNRIRNLSSLNNQTPPVYSIFEAKPDASSYRTTFIDVSCYSGTVLSRMHDISLIEYMKIIRTIAKTAGYYHNAGYLCLDIKPENIFVMRNAPDDTVTELVEFIDFDSIKEISSLNSDTVISCTKDWAAPEILNNYPISSIGVKADIYTLGELVFFYVFGRHSFENEHRGFSEYPFNECRHEYTRFTMRPDIRSILTKIFRGTIRSSASNRFERTADVTDLLDKLIDSLGQKDYVIPRLPVNLSNFIGRENEITIIERSLNENHILYIYGLGGIGKSTLARNYIHKFKAKYDVIIYLEYTGDIIRTVSDDDQLQISTVRRLPDESPTEYFNRKLNVLRVICSEKSVLFVLDNFYGRITKELSRILEYGYDTIITSRKEPPKNSFACLEVTSISDISKLYELIALNLSRPIRKDERTAFNEMIGLVQGHTLTLELIARQISAGHMDAEYALKIIKKHGFSHLSDDKISNFKDGEETYGTLSNIISALFSAAGISSQAKTVLKVLSLMDVRGLDSFVISDIVKFDMNVINRLSKEGWLYDEPLLITGSRIRLHPVITETVRNWSWDDIELDDLSVMEYYKKMTDVYVSTDSKEQLDLISNEAGRYSRLHPRHMIKGIYHDIRADYYDVCCVDYVPYNEDEAKPIISMINEMDRAIAEIRLSGDSHKNMYLIKYYISFAAILIRSTPDGGTKAAGLLRKVHGLLKKTDMPEFCDNRCYYDMTCAWYYTLIEPDIKKTLALTAKAQKIAYKVFPTELEISDIIYIPTANCLFFHNDLEGAAQKLEEAVEICKKYPDKVQYLSKHLDLLSFLLDVYLEAKDFVKCRAILSEIDKINDDCAEYGIFREIPQEMRKSIREPSL